MESCYSKTITKRALSVLSASCVIAFTGGCGPRKGAAPPPAAIPEVSVITVKTEEATLTSELPGRATAFLVAEVRPQVGGIIQKRLFEEGTRVKAGDLLYQIDPAIYQATYDGEIADLERAEAKITSIKKKYERYKTLIASKAVSQQEFDNAESDLKTAEADILSCKAALETARINLAYTKILAPISGRIGRSQITVGALVTANHLTPLAIIQQIDPIYVDVTQSSTSLLRLKREMLNGQLENGDVEQTKVKLILEDGIPYSHVGVLQFRDVTVDRTTGSFILRIVFPNPDEVLLPGMFLRAVLGTGVKGQAILIPQQAVSRDSKGRPLVLIVDDTSKVAQRIISVDRTIGDKWLVSSGLAPGDRVIVEGMQKVRHGVEVKVVPFGGAQAPGTNPATTVPSAAKTN